MKQTMKVGFDIFEYTDFFKRIYSCDILNFLVKTYAKRGIESYLDFIAFDTFMTEVTQLDNQEYIKIPLFESQSVLRYGIDDENEPVFYILPTIDIQNVPK